MSHSEQLNELAAALCKAQGKFDAHAESTIIWKLRRAFNYKPSNKRITDKQKYFFNNIAFGVSDCWYWTGNKNPDGYGLIARSIGGGGAHRLSYRLHHNNIELSTAQVIRHTCDVRLCVNPDHLVLGTQQENIADMVQKNRQWRPKGEANVKAKLTLQKAQEIRRRFASGESHTSLAEAFGVGFSTIYRVVNRENWNV